MEKTTTTTKKVTTKATKKVAVTKAAPKKATAVSLSAPIYSQAGKEVSTITLPKSVFGVVWNADLVHQVVVSMNANKRAGTAHTKDRSEVSGGGKKPWKQKGTGRSRHGSSRSPIWSGGGITFGPRSDKDYSKKINKKMRAKALYTVLSRKLTDGHLLLVDSLSLSAKKTKDAVTITEVLATIAGFEKMTSTKKTTALIALPERNEVIEKSFANLPGITTILAADINALTVMGYNYVVMVAPETVVPALEAKMK